MQNKKKRNVLIGALAVLLVAFAVGGTIAWLTAANSVSNTFTVGEITPPEEKPDPGYPDPDPDNPDNPAQFDGNIYEIYKKDSEVYPGAAVQKQPFIGVGADSKPAYVFVYVDSAMVDEGVDNTHTPYFSINDGWAPVDGYATPYTGEDAVEGKTFTKGLFVLGTESSGNITPSILTPDGTNDAWSSYVFDWVYVPDATTADEFVDSPQMDVWCYLYAAVDDATYKDAEDAAKAWCTSGDGLQAIEGTATAE